MARTDVESATIREFLELAGRLTGVPMSVIQEPDALPIPGNPPACDAIGDKNGESVALELTSINEYIGERDGNPRHVRFMELLQRGLGEAFQTTATSRFPSTPAPFQPGLTMMTLFKKPSP